MNNQKFKRMILALALVLAVGVTMTGCMSEGNRGLLLDSQSDTATPGRPSPSLSAGNSGAQGGQSGPSVTNEARADFDWTRDAAQVEARLNQISEISEARVVVTGDTALVGVKFDRAYQGEMTERIREMVASEVMAADPRITTVAVTADAQDVGTVYELSERTSLGRDLDTLKEDIEEIVRNATTLR